MHQASQTWKPGFNVTHPRIANYQREKERKKIYIIAITNTHGKPNAVQQTTWLHIDVSSPSGASQARDLRTCPSKQSPWKFWDQATWWQSWWYIQYRHEQSDEGDELRLQWCAKSSCNVHEWRRLMRGGEDEWNWKLLGHTDCLFFLLRVRFSLGASIAANLLGLHSMPDAEGLLFSQGLALEPPPPPHTGVMGK